MRGGLPQPASFLLCCRGQQHKGQRGARRLLAGSPLPFSREVRMVGLSHSSQPPIALWSPCVKVRWTKYVVRGEILARVLT